ncbi:MAG: hypothetical protein ACI4P3_03575 [Candidatus Spyradosoma sp.]
MSNISVPSNFISLVPAAPAGTPVPFTSIAAAPQANKLAVLADSDFPEAQWNLGGVFLYDESRTQLCDFAQENFGRARAVAETHGAPPCAWTLEWYRSRPLIPPGDIAARLKALAGKPAAFVLSLDNPHVPEDTLNDAVGNTLLNYAAQMPRAAVSVASEPLAEHVRKNFPSLALRAGMNKVIAENGRGDLEYYRSAAKRYSVVAVHPDDAADPAFMKTLAEEIGAEKFEITVNDSCLRRCPVRERHLAALAKIRRSPWDAAPLRERHQALAEAKCEEVSVADGADAPRAALLSREELRGLYALGFRRFRIQAETLRSEIAFFWSALGWLISAKPEHWHYAGLIASSLITKIKEPVPVLPTGLAPFVKRKYD